MQNTQSIYEVLRDCDVVYSNEDEALIIVWNQSHTLLLWTEVGPGQFIQSDIRTMHKMPTSLDEAKKAANEFHDYLLEDMKDTEEL